LIETQASNWQNVGDVVPWSSTTTSYWQPVRTRTKHIPDCHVARIGNGHAVILIPYLAILDKQIDGIANIESVRVVSCRESFADTVWSIAEWVVHDYILYRRIENSCDIDSVRWIILNIQISHDWVVCDLDLHELARSALISIVIPWEWFKGLLGKSPIWTKAIPILRPSSINYGSWCSFDSDITTGNLKWSELRAVRKCKACSSRKPDWSSDFELSEDNGATRWCVNVVKCDRHTSCHCGRDLRPSCA